MSTSGAVRLPRNADPVEVERRLGAELADGGRCVVAGPTARELRHVLDYANAEGLELRDPVGHCLRLERFLRDGRGDKTRSRRTYRPWCIEVLRPADVPQGLLVQEWGPNPDGRRIVFGASASWSAASGARRAVAEAPDEERCVG